MSKVRFACYGTLKSNYGNNRLLKGAQFLGECATPPVYTLFDGGFPIVERGGDTAIQCEVYETDNQHIISNVFNLEGSSPIQHSEDNWYDWDKVETPFGDAIIFVIDRGKSGRNKIVQSGKW